MRFNPLIALLAAAFAMTSCSSPPKEPLGERSDRVERPRRGSETMIAIVGTNDLHGALAPVKLVTRENKASYRARSLGKHRYPASPASATSLCPIGRHWVRAHHRRAYKRADGTPVGATNVSAHCADNLAGYELWSARLAKGRPENWPVSSEKTKEWSTEERERALEALSELPKALWARTLKGLFRMARSRDFPNPATSRRGDIVLYDNAFDSSSNLARVLAHELAHQDYWALSEDEQKSYKMASGWMIGELLGGKEFVVNRGTGFVEEDGKASPEEDFANNVEYFLFNTQKLRDTTPHAHSWMQRHYGATFKIRSSRR